MFISIFSLRHFLTFDFCKNSVYFEDIMLKFNIKPEVDIKDSCALNLNFFQF